MKKKEISEKILKCPKCNIDMRKIKKNDVVIDICESCTGMWLDDHEISKLLNYAKGGKDGKKNKQN